jgi:hypothetical protein
MDDNNEISDELKELVVERLKSMPSNLQISVGGNEYTKTEILDHVQKGDGIGKQMAEIQLQFLQDLTSGKIFSDE